MLSKKYLIPLICCFISSTSIGQKSFNDFIDYGDYSIGYFDSLIYNSNQHYVQHGYSGDAPLFVQIWHPIDVAQSGRPLKFEEFRVRTVSKHLKTVYDTLCWQMDKSSIQYNISKDFVQYKPIDYSPYTIQDVLNSIKNYPTKSTFSPLKKRSDFPVIIYHHGAQGFSDENFAMAEYFASKGYIFVSANYHLPFENLTYASTTGSINYESFPKRVTEFARELTSNNELYYIGHSWGAQNGFRYLHEEGWADAFVSLETTIEFKDDTNKIKELWPPIFDLIATQEKKYPLQILMIANTGEDKPFEFFKPIGNDKLYFATAKTEFGHESYTSAYHMRHLFNQRFPQPDSVEMRDQIELYAEHLKLIEAFLTSVQQKTNLDKTRFGETFFINE